MRSAPRLPSPARAVAVAAAIAVVPATAVLAFTATSSAATFAANYPAHYAAPYLQISSGDAHVMAADMKASGDKYYTLAFLTPANGTCTPLWEDGGEPMNAFVSEVKSLQAAGGNAIISFGGASGGEIAQTCPTASALEAQYAQVVSTYGVNRLDFDIEGSVFGDGAANTRRDQALAMLQKADPSVAIDFTIGTGPNGLSGGELTFLKNAKSAGVKINMVNIMTMYFGTPENQLLTDCKDATTATAKQLQQVFGTSSPDYAQVGDTPFIGNTGAGSDNGNNEKFTLAMADAFEPFAAQLGVQELSFWQVAGLDTKTGYQYSGEFNKITG